MFILTIDGREDDGAYAVRDENGEQILYIFEEEDDATRFALMLEETENEEVPKMHIIEIEDEIILKTCESYGYNYSIITKNDIVIPPRENDLF